MKFDQLKYGDAIFCGTIAFSLVFPIRFPAIVIYLYGLFVFVRLFSNEKKRFSFTPEEIGLIIYFIMAMISLAFVATDEKVWSHVEKRASFLFIPLLFCLRSTYINATVKKLSLYAFMCSCLIATLLTFANAVIKSLQFKNGSLVFNAAVKGEGDFMTSVIYGGNHFFHDEYSVFMHPTYFSVYLLLAIAFLMSEINTIGWSAKRFYLNLILIAWFCVNVYLLSSRAALLSVVVLIIAGLLGKKYSAWTRSISWAVGGLLILVIVVVYSNPRIKAMFSTEELLNHNPRWHIWNVGYRVATENLPWGTGLANLEKVTISTYNAVGYSEGANNEYNLHNQYLEALAGMGIPGLSALILLLALCVYRAYRMNNILYLSFILIMAFNLLFESMLNRFSGIVFLTFFICLFSRQQPEESKN